MQALDRKPRRILRLGAVKAIVPFSTAEIYRRMKLGLFPRPVPMGPRARGWIEDEVVAVAEQMIAERDAGAKAEVMRR